MAKVPNLKFVVAITSVKRQLSTWKRQLLENAASLFESRDKPSKETTERIAELEQLVGRLKVAMDIQKKALTLLSENRDPDAQGGKGSPK